MEPEIGDKVICLRNCWETCSIGENNPLINGTIGYLDKIELGESSYKIDRSTSITVPVLYADLIVDKDRYMEVKIDYTALTTGKKYLTPKQEYSISKLKENPSLPIEFNYGYAITCHKSQGSQWDKILLLEESFPFDKEEHARWLYTGVTRAAQKATLILKE